MPFYDFIPTETDYLLFKNIEAESLDAAPAELEFELQMHDEFEVKPQPGGVPAVDVFLKGHHLDTLTISEHPTLDLTTEATKQPAPDPFDKNPRREYQLARAIGESRYGSDCLHEKTRGGRCLQCQRIVKT